MQIVVQEHKVEETTNALASGRGQHELVLESLNGSSAAAQHSMQPAQQYTATPSHQQPAAQLVSVSWSCLCACLCPPHLKHPFWHSFKHQQPQQ